MKVISEALAKAGIEASELRAIGITNQRETAVIWDRYTESADRQRQSGRSRRTADICEELKSQGSEQEVARTGLVVDAYFSGTKVKWLSDHVPGSRQRAENGELVFGTIDTWLV